MVQKYQHKKSQIFHCHSLTNRWQQKEHCRREDRMWYYDGKGGHSYADLKCFTVLLSQEQWSRLRRKLPKPLPSTPAVLEKGLHLEGNTQQWEMLDTRSSFCSLIGYQTKLLNEIRLGIVVWIRHKLVTSTLHGAQTWYSTTYSCGVLVNV